MYTVKIHPDIDITRSLLTRLAKQSLHLNPDFTLQQLGDILSNPDPQRPPPEHIDLPINNKIAIVLRNKWVDISEGLGFPPDVHPIFAIPFLLEAYHLTLITINDIEPRLAVYMLSDSAYERLHERSLYYHTTHTQTINNLFTQDPLPKIPDNLVIIRHKRQIQTHLNLSHDALVFLQLAAPLILSSTNHPLSVALDWLLIEYATNPYTTQSQTQTHPSTRINTGVSTI